MQKEVMIRICSTCKKPLPWSETESGQAGYICCDEYYCSGICLAQSFPEGYSWGEHYAEQGGDENSDCFYTEWELEDSKGDAV